MKRDGAELSSLRSTPAAEMGQAVSKAAIVGELGEKKLLLPTLIQEALAANDRAKYFLTLLQTAREHADHPGAALSNLRRERLAADVADDQLDTVVEHASREGADAYFVPALHLIHERLLASVRSMLNTVADQFRNGSTPAGCGYEQRLQALLAEAPSLTADMIPGRYLEHLTSGQREKGDSLHLLIMDLHKELNRLQQQLATETIDGAHVYGVLADDRPLIAAFMAGVEQTRALKFDHPGLGTTATRSGRRLVIQNDIGLTDAHVLVVHVEDGQVALTYTDVHIERLVFFQNLFDRYGRGTGSPADGTGAAPAASNHGVMTWNDTVSRRSPGLKEDLYHLCLGTYQASDQADLLSFLTYLGSRLVFLIDWNRARKRLRRFAPRRVCLQVLRWAADQNHGHRGFLALGGEQLIFDALQIAGRLELTPGAQLSDFLGPERTAEFLKFTLQTASEGLRGGRSEFLIRDEISAELRRYLDTAHQRMLEVAAEHASLIVELAVAARDLLLAAGPARDRQGIERIVLRARKWEHRADELVNRCRAAQDPGSEAQPILGLLVAADDCADGLEDAIFLMSLFQEASNGRTHKDKTGSTASPLADLAGSVLRGAQEYLKAVENARHLHRGSTREQVDDFLEAVDLTMKAEHQSDDAHRLFQAAVLQFAGDFKQWHLSSGVADKLEETADSLMRSALLLRDHILREVLNR